MELLMRLFEAKFAEIISLDLSGSGGDLIF
jgi:hypothetical protein